MNKPEPRTAATVVLLRDSASGPEVLLLRRNKSLGFAGGAWVFPGGALDPEDWEQADGDEARAARIGAAREASEEAGLSVDPDLMVQISHWTTPEAEPKRFYTWFFLAQVEGSGDIEIDGGEIHEFRWVPVADAVAEHDAGGLRLFPPTIMTLRCLNGYMSVEDALIGMAARDPHTVFPVYVLEEEGKPPHIMFRGDAGYESADPNVEGARHRVQFEGKSWQYQHEDVDPAIARLDS